MNGRAALTSAPLTSGALVIALFSVASRLMGVVRDRLLATTFGAGPVLDAYYAAFKLPDFIFNTMVLGAVASAFIPVYVRLRRLGSGAAVRLTQTLMTGLGATLVLWAVLAAVFAPGLLRLVAPGFDADRQALAVGLMRTMLLAMVSFGVSNVVGSLLQAERRFTAFAAAPLAYNFGIIVGVLFFTRVAGPVGLAWGVVLGSLLHLLVQLPSAYRSGFRLRPAFGFSDAAVRQVGRLLAPRTLGLAATQLNGLVTAAFISHLSVGTLAAFTLATNLQSFPINVVGVSLAVAAFPVFSEALGNGQHAGFAVHFRESVRRILFFVLPLAVLFLVLRAQVVRAVLGAGAFGWDDTIRTAQALGFLALGMVSDSLVPLVARVFYALQDTRTPVLVSLVSMVVNFALLVLLRPFGLAGVGIAYVASSLTNVGLLTAMLGRRLHNLGTDDIVGGAQRMVVAAAAAGATAYATLHLVAPLVNMRTFVGIVLQGAAAGAAGVAAYLAVASAWRLPEVEFVRRWLRGAWNLSRRVWATS